MYKNEQMTFTPEQLTAMVFTKLKENVEKNTKAKVAEAVLSVPGFWNDTQRRAMRDAAKIADLPVSRLLNDLTAAAIGYGLYKADLPAPDSTTPFKVMFIDMGDAHFSVGIVHFWNGKLKVVASAHDSTLGGRNFDLALAQFFAEGFKAKHKLDLRTNPKVQ
jgi:molecular chaperone DnaK (HSP70)